MDVRDFCIKNDLVNMNEIDKVAYLAFFVQWSKSKNIFTIVEIVDILRENNLCNPNISRLKVKIRKNKRFMCKGENFALTQKAYLEISQNCIMLDFETIKSNSEFIDENLFNSSPTYLKSLVKQINCSYANNLFDAVAVLIRRVFEILLIKTYLKIGIDDEIKANGNYVTLEKIIDNAIQNKKLSLSRSKKDLDSIRNVGNYSAHKLEYNANKNDIDKIKDKYRLIVEELLYKSGLKT